MEFFCHANVERDLGDKIGRERQEGKTGLRVVVE